MTTKTTTEIRASGDRLQTLTLTQRDKTPPGTALLNALKKFSPVTDCKGDVNEAATLIKSLHAGKRHQIHQPHLTGVK